MKSFNIFVISNLIFITTAFAKVERPPQYVMLAFDGSKDVGFWQESRNFAAQTPTTGIDGKKSNLLFTYFMSGVYYITNAAKGVYIEPTRGAGKSAIGFGGTVQNLQPRVQQVEKAVNEGHEMASHGNAHFDDSKYTEKEWNSEFDQFTELMLNAWKGTKDGWVHGGQSVGADISSKEPKWWKDLFTNHIRGFRAPLLGTGDGLWKALQDHHFVYDTSRVDKMNYWPKKVNGMWNFPLAGVKIAGSGKNTLSMDYNFYYAQSNGQPGPKDQYQKYEDQMFNTYMNYFKSNYYGNRAPVHIGHHFSKWNGGAYWKAMQHFAQEVCNQPEVRCVTYTQLASYMDTLNETTIAAHQKGDFDKMAAPKPVLASLRSVRELSDKELEEVRSQQSLHFKAHTLRDHQ